MSTDRMNKEVHDSGKYAEPSSICEIREQGDRRLWMPMGTGWTTAMHPPQCLSCGQEAGCVAFGWGAFCSPPRSYTSAWAVVDKQILDKQNCEKVRTFPQEGLAGSSL